MTLIRIFIIALKSLSLWKTFTNRLFTFIKDSTTYLHNKMFIFAYYFHFSTTHKNGTSFFRFAPVAIIGYFPALSNTLPPTHFLKKSSFFQKTAWQIAKWVYIKPVVTDKVMIPKWRGSSVGRAEDWKSSCHQFDPGPCHHFFVYTPDGDTPFGFFCACVWGWIARIYDFFSKTENLKSPHSGGLKSVKIPQILRLAILGDTGMCQVITAWYVGWMLQKHPCFSLFSSECNEEFLYTNRRPLSIFLDNQIVTRKSEIFVLLTNAHRKTDVPVSPFAILHFSGISFYVLTVFCFALLR